MKGLNSNVFMDCPELENGDSRHLSNNINCLPFYAVSYPIGPEC